MHCGIAGGGTLSLLGVHGGAASRVIGTLGVGGVTIGVGACRLNVTHCGARLGWLLTSGLILSGAGSASVLLLLVATLRDDTPTVLAVLGSTFSAGRMVMSSWSVVATPWHEVLA